MALDDPKRTGAESWLEGATLSAAQSRAAERLRSMGLPGRRDEYWKYTNPESLTARETPTAQPFAGDDETLFDDIDRLRLVFVDGVFDAAASDDLEGSGLRLLDPETDSNLGVLEADVHSHVDRPLMSLNTALARNGVVIDAEGKQNRPVHLIYRLGEATSDAMVHHIIRVAEGADLTVLESGVGAARLNTMMEVDVADGAAFHHVRAQGRNPDRRTVTGLVGMLGQDSTFKSFTLSLNGTMTRNECVLSLKGADAVAHVAGAAVGDGAAFHHDDTVFITHAAPNCESRQVFKKVLRNGAVGVFQGKILVDPVAQKTDGYQISQSLLLDGDSQFLAKPELEIYADDVICSHGSTSGAIDDEALFYLRSRGVPEGAAQDMLVLAFLAEALSEIEDEALAAALQDQLEGWLSRRRD